MHFLNIFKMSSIKKMIFLIILISIFYIFKIHNSNINILGNLLIKKNKNYIYVNMLSYYFLLICLDVAQLVKRRRLLTNR